MNFYEGVGDRSCNHTFHKGRVRAFVGFVVIHRLRPGKAAQSCRRKAYPESEKQCIYCGAEKDLHREHILPKSLAIKSECLTCDKIQGIHNQEGST